jgi:hypothetical protein
LPEVWIPYGEVETLVSVDAENIGSVVNPDPEKSAGETDRLSEKLKRATRLFVCDSRPTTVELLRDLAPAVAAVDALKVVAEDPKRIEYAVPQLKSRLSEAIQPVSDISTSEHLGAQGAKVFVGTASPDPLFGIADPKVAACRNWVVGSHEEAAQKRKDMEPTPFERTDAYASMEETAFKIPDASFVTVIPRSGRVRSAMEDAPFEAIRNGFYGETLPASKALIVGAGGSGYDQTLSSALRSIWGVLGCVRKSGEVLLMAECSKGLGSQALEMLVTGRIAGEGRRKEKYVPGLEEVYYLHRLKEDYDVMLMSGLPELYAKSKLGFATAKGSGEAVGRLISKAGRTSKVNVVARASECRIESG